MQRMPRPRVCSVLPSATEILCLIGGGPLLVGRSHEDNFPDSITHLPVLTGQKTTFTTAKDVDAQVSKALSSGQSLYTLDTELLATLKPDVILTQDICSVCAIDLPTVERVAAKLSPAPSVLSLNPEDLTGVLQNVLQVGHAVGMEEAASAAHAALLKRIARVDAAVADAANRRRPNVAFIEWSDPICARLDGLTHCSFHFPAPYLLLTDCVHACNFRRGRALDASAHPARGWRAPAQPCDRGERWRCW